MGISKEALREISFSKWPSFMQGIEHVQQDALTNVYIIFGFLPLYNFHFGISELLRVSTFTYLGADTIDSHPEKPLYDKRSRTRTQTSILRAVNCILTVRERYSSLPGLRIDLSHRECSLQLIGFQLYSGGPGVLEGKNCCALDMVSLTVCGSIDRVSGYTKS